MQLIDSKEAAESVWNYAILNRQRSVVVEDEVVAGDLIVAAAIFMDISTIMVKVEHGDPVAVRRAYTVNGTAHGSTSG